MLIRISLEEPTGPRDAMLKELLRQLLTFDNFQNFAYMMHSSTRIMDRNVTNEASIDGNLGNCHEKSLLSMGFDRELVRVVLESAAEDTPLDDIVHMLSEMGASSDAFGNSDSKDIIFSPRYAIICFINLHVHQSIAIELKSCMF